MWHGTRFVRILLLSVVSQQTHKRSHTRSSVGSLIVLCTLLSCSYAIAYAVVHYLSHYVGCLGLFSTHYRQLTTEFQCHPRVGLYHMNCSMDPEHRTVLFLYQLTQGVCPQSYGMNVAAMAGLPLSIIDRATTIAAQLESISKLSANAMAVTATPAAETRRRISVAELADLYYMLSVTPSSRHPLIAQRIMESFTKSTLA